MGRKIIDLTEKRFGKLVALSVHKYIDNTRIYWLCLCDCGKETIVTTSHLHCGKIRSCGCLKDKGNNLKHGHTKNAKQSKTYIAWNHMIQRCNNPKNINYKYYGGRGITVCERWMKFENFLKDIGEIPSGLTLDRIDNNDNYTPNNWRFATWKEQANNKRNNKRK